MKEPKTTASPAEIAAGIKALNAKSPRAARKSQPGTAKATSPRGATGRIRPSSGIASTARSELEALFERQCLAVLSEQPEREVKFHPVRRFRFDFAWKAKMVAVEIEGMGRGGLGRHQRPEGFAGDCLKYNLAASTGWKVFRFVGAQVRSGHAIEFISEVLNGASR